MKFGAFPPCRDCGSEPPDQGLAIIFSDHHLSEGLLETFGGLVGRIREAGASADETPEVLLVLIARQRPEFLAGAQPPESVREAVEPVLEKLGEASLPPLVRDPGRGRGYWRLESEPVREPPPFTPIWIQLGCLIVIATSCLTFAYVWADILWGQPR